MTQLEKTINQIFSERKEKINKDIQKRNSLDKADQNSKIYIKEFNSIYEKIPKIYEIKNEFIRWIDECTIDDHLKQINTGSEFYQNLLQKAHSQYQSDREKGYEQKKAFDKATEELISGIENSNVKESGETIFLKYDTEFYHRLRHNMFD